LPIGIEDLIRAKSSHHFTVVQVLLIAAVPALLAALFSYLLVRGKESSFLNRFALTSMLVFLNLFLGALCLIVGGFVSGIVGTTDAFGWLLYGFTISAITVFDMCFSRWLIASASRESY